MTFIDSIRRTVGRGPRDAAPDVASPADASREASTAAEGTALDASVPMTASEPIAPASPPAAPTATGASIEIAPSDPLFAYLQSATGVVDAERLELESPALDELRAAGIRVIVPLVTQGELIGALYLGPRLSDQDYSTDDRKLLSTLAAQAAPAIRVAQLVREQAVEIQARERLEQEMRVATLIQQQFLPRDLPELRDWQVAAYYGPARAVGGDFYDFIALPDGRIGIVVGDVTDKGVPAALIMARTQSVLRGEAPRLMSPAKVLERANEILLPEMPARMFVTCLYMILDPETGQVVYANAGHNLPYVRTADGVLELRATGMPLGLLPGMDYPEHEAVLAPGESVLLYSDGLVEAHDQAGDMFGFPRLRELLATELPGSELLDHLLDELHGFVGKGWDQEDDITLVTLQRTGGWGEPAAGPAATPASDAPGMPAAEASPRSSHDRILLRTSLPGEPGNERLAMDRVAGAVAELGIAGDRLERLKTAVSEAAMNAIEYGSQNDPTIPIEIEAAVEGAELVVRITDRGLSGPLGGSEEPDLDKKLAGEQKPRGWGLFLIKHMVDAMEVTPHGTGQTVTLTLHLEGARDASDPVQG
jgi:serine phosphatase RsbU (regulator of sigma subunit)/anti-sigma regulatory factor (Ser/Thr protein kinase)